MSDQDIFRTVIDLTHNLNDRSPNWEGTVESPYESRELGNLERDGYYSRIFTTPGALWHASRRAGSFATEGWTVDQIPAERLCGRW